MSIGIRAPFCVKDAEEALQTKNAKKELSALIEATRATN